MALTSLGIGGVLTFDSSKAVRSMAVASKAFGKLSQKATTLRTTMAGLGKRFGASLAMGARNLGGAFSNMGAAVRTAGMGLLPATMGLKKAIGTAAGFEQKMSGVKAVMKGITEEEFKMLNLKAKEMGVLSVFSAAQSADALKFLGQAGFTAKEGVVALDGTINAAAASGIELAEAAQLISSSVRAFGLDASEATRVADVMALTTARTNTDMTQLGEGLKYVTPIAKGMGMEIEETSAVLGLLADAGVRGTMGGTALKNALLKMADPSKKGAREMKRMGLSIKDANGNLLPMTDILQQLKTGMNKTGGAVNRTAAASRLFGLRGVMLTSLLERLDKSGKDGALTLGELHEQLKNAAGSAKEMADIKLDNLLGQFTLLGASIEGVSIEIFEGMLGPFKDSIKSIIGDKESGLNGILIAVQKLKTLTPEELKKVGGVDPKHLTTTMQIALGVMDAVEWMKEAWKGLTAQVSKFSTWLNDKLGGEGVRSLTKMIIKFVTIAGALTPILLGVGLFAWILKASLVPAISAVGLAFKVALGPVGIIIIGIIALLKGMQRENEDILDTVIRAWGGLVRFLKGIYDNVIKPFVDGFIGIFKFAFDIIGDIFNSIKEIVESVFSIFVNSTENSLYQTSIFWETFGQVIATVLGAMLLIVKTIVGWISSLVKGIAGAIRGFLEWIGLAEQHAARTITEVKYIPIVTELAKAGMADYDITTEGLKKGTIESSKMRMAAAKVAEQITPAKLAKMEPAAVKEVGPEFIQMIKDYWKQRQEAELKLYEQKEDIKVDISGSQDINVKSTVNVDKKKIATAVSRQRIEILERTGSKKQPWQPMRNLELEGFDLSPTRG